MNAVEDGTARAVKGYNDRITRDSISIVIYFNDSRELFMVDMVGRLKEIWHAPRDIEEAEVILLVGIFATIWMLMIIW